jgi:hypothetical protein
MKPRSTFIRLLSLGLLMGPCPVTADHGSTPNQSGSGVAVDTSRWTCALCPYRFGWTGVIDIGGGWVSDASNKFGDYRGLEDEGGFLALDGEAHFRDRQGGFADIYFKDLGIDSRRFQASGGTRGRYTLDFRFQEIPKYRGFGTQTPYLGTGGAALALPSNWQSAQTTSGMSSLATALQSVDLQTTRKTLDGG